MNAKYLQWTTSDASACGTTTRSHLAVIGDETTPTALYQGTPEACTAVAPAALDIYLEIYDFYEVGAELPASTFVEITEGTL